MNILTTLTAATIALTATIAAADGYGSPSTASAKGKYLTAADGMTLYTFDKDSNGTSNCYDGCAAAWPPLTTKADASLPSGFSAIARKDGTHQIAYKGQPLYLWANDSKPGDTTGDGVNGVWHIARP